MVSCIKLIHFMSFGCSKCFTRYICVCLNLFGFVLICVRENFIAQSLESHYGKGSKLELKRRRFQFYECTTRAYQTSLVWHPQILKFVFLHLILCFIDVQLLGLFSICFTLCVYLSGVLFSNLGFSRNQNFYSNNVRILSYKFLDSPIQLPLGCILSPFFTPDGSLMPNLPRRIIWKRKDLNVGQRE